MKALALLTLSLALVSLGGCATNKQTAERASLVSQNQQQAAQLEQLNTELQQANAARAAAEARAAALTNQAGQTPPDNGGVVELGGAPIGGRAGRGTTPAGRPNTPVARGNAGGNREVIEIGGDILFDSGRTVIKTTATKSLDTLAARIKRDYAGRTIRIVGHTDATPMKPTAAIKDNTALGLARANSVKNYLAKQGIPAREMTAQSRGATQPKSTTNLAANRRVEIIVE